MVSWGLEVLGCDLDAGTRVIFFDLVLHYVRRHSLLARECCFPA